jgi:hypothetical protein
MTIMADSGRRGARLSEQPQSTETFALRDYLQRSVVTLDWVELASDNDCQIRLWFVPKRSFKYTQLVSGAPSRPAPWAGRRRGINMHKYEIVIYWSNEDQVFVAEVPEIAGLRGPWQHSRSGARTR